MCMRVNPKTLDRVRDGKAATIVARPRATQSRLCDARCRIRALNTPPLLEILRATDDEEFYRLFAAGRIHAGKPQNIRLDYVRISWSTRHTIRDAIVGIMTDGAAEQLWRGNFGDRTYDMQLLHLTEVSNREYMRRHRLLISYARS